MAVTAAVLAVGGTLPASAGQSHGSVDGVRQGVERLVADDKFPAAPASTVDCDGHARNTVLCKK
ncbi:hypothetical protein [Kitasatospora sp. GP82]|uniref:hypothetical protein n=1 Tax=Kitasatospora sp. GP82 TaxID=3035089 RepID=UPI0024740F65|nr:hypothetical protein [Kitasatospora sp. GP82]